MRSTGKDRAALAAREAVDVWRAVYAEALRRGPHNPAGSRQRADQLARAYMAGWLRNQTPGTSFTSCASGIDGPG
jgi:hypothetical protein